VQKLYVVGVANSVVDCLPIGLLETFPLLQTTMVVVCQQMIALDDLGGGSCSVRSSICLFCTIGSQGMARELAV